MPTDISALSWLFLPILIIIFRRAVISIGVPRLASCPQPGPTPVPIFGNAHQIPKDRQWLKFDEWHKRYGDLIFLKVFRQPNLVIGSTQAAFDLLDARGAIYSGRPPATMVGEPVGWNQGLGYNPGPPNTRFRDFRKLFHRFIGPHACEDANITSILQRENRKLLVKLLKGKGKNFADAARDSTSSMVLHLTYGYEAKDRADPFVHIAEDAMLGFSKASEPGWLVDSFPFLKYIPGWIPGIPFKTAARAFRKDLERLYDIPFAFVKEQTTAGLAKTSFVSSYLSEGGDEPTPEQEEFIKAAAASLYSGAAETTPSSVNSFILAMTLYPDVQTRAQEELDAVLGSPTHINSELRLPTLADRPKLPYVNALVKEVWRWNPSVPLGLPHMLVKDDVYQGHDIKKGTVVWANIWSMLHDVGIYPEPFTFKPERFLDEITGRLRKLSKAEDPAQIAFGFGRRICPGIDLAETSVFLNIATILYAMHISKARAEDGTEIVPVVEYNGLICHPGPFECNIEARSRELEDLLLSLAPS